MSVIGLMVSICIVGILTAIAIPFYMCYVQQSRVVSIIIPRLHPIETNISLFYSMHNRLPGKTDTADILQGIDTGQCRATITNGSIVMTIQAP